MILTKYHDLLARLDWSAKGRRRKAFREAKLLATLSPAHATLFNAFEAGETPPAPAAQEPEPLPSLWPEESAEAPDAAAAVSAAERFDPLIHHDDHRIPQFVIGDTIAGPARHASTPAGMPPFPSLIYPAEQEEPAPAPRKPSLWRRIASAGGWLLWAATVCAIITYNAAAPVPQRLEAAAPQEAAPGLTIIRKTYVDQVPQ